MRTRWILLLALAVAPACAGAETGPGAAPPPAASMGAVPAPVAQPPVATAQPPAAPATVAAAPAGPAPCGALECMLYDSPRDAFAAVLATRPRILGIGETHAQKGTEGIPSATRRFTDDFIPMLRDRASDLLIELWVADRRCAKEKVAKVQKQQQAATQSQADENQNEFVTLAAKAKGAGITPHVLRPSCAEYDQILRAGDDAINQMLTMITRLTAAKTKALLEHSPADKVVVTYGGALHNDVVPRPGREQWSFGPELGTLTGGKYVELDIIVREFIKDNESWRSLPWYPHFDRERQPDKTVLYRPAPGSYVLIFPAAVRPGGP